MGMGRVVQGRRAVIRWLLSLFRRREVLPAPDRRCERGIDGEYMRGLRR